MGKYIQRVEFLEKVTACVVSHGQERLIDYTKGTTIGLYSDKDSIKRDNHSLSIHLADNNISILNIPQESVKISLSWYNPTPCSG